MIIIGILAIVFSIIAIVIGILERDPTTFEGFLDGIDSFFH